ncbi:MAG TPA: hypothetical protein VFT65_03750 [Candidatus Angelobacter sp.]|nr:hypothetical protein [Candidatus Angelobacter sp.]
MKFTRLCFVLLIVAPALWAQKPADNPVAKTLFPPELVMRFHQEISLDDSQSRAMRDAIQNAQGKFVSMQWDLQTETDKLVKLLKAHPVDEQATMVQVDHVLDRERDIKKAQISLLIRIKNLLTEAQQTKLMELAADTLLKQP